MDGPTSDHEEEQGDHGDQPSQVDLRPTEHHLNPPFPASLVRNAL
jgi:hypothetical protein